MSEFGNPVPINISGGYNPVRYPAINNQTCFNLCQIEKGKMVPTPGDKFLLELIATGRMRGGEYSKLLSGAIVVVDDAVYLVTSRHKKRLFNIDTLTGNVSIAENGLRTEPKGADPGGQIAIADGAFIYVYTLDGKVKKATNSSSGSSLGFNPTHIKFVNSLFFSVDSVTNRIHSSELNDARIFPADHYDQISSITRSLAIFKQMVLVFGQDEVEIFHPDTRSPFPYSKDITTSFEYGLLAPWSLAQGFGVMVWLAGNNESSPTILASDGGQPEQISTPGVDNVLNELSKPNDAEGFLYEENGLTYYQLNFIEDNLSLLYSFDFKQWYKVTDPNLDAHHIKKVINLESENKLLGISYKDGNVYEFSSQYYNHNGEVIPRIIISDTQTNHESPQTFDEVHLQMEQGENDQESKIFYYVSKDRGRTFHLIEEKPLANYGERDGLLRFHKLGSSRWWTHQFRGYSKDRLVFMQATGFQR